MFLNPSPVEPTELVAGCVAIYRNIWKNPETTINQIESIVSSPNFPIKFEPAYTDGDNEMSVKNNTPREQTIRTNESFNLYDASIHSDDLRQINNRYYDLCLSTSEWYSKHFGFHPSVRLNEPFEVLKYGEDQHYEQHYDGLTDSGRSISTILYLNDSFSGGEIEFNNFNIKIKPEPGMFVLFPSNYAYRHIAHPVKNGIKYAIVTWLHDRVSDCDCDFHNKLKQRIR